MKVGREVLLKPAIGAQHSGETLDHQARACQQHNRQRDLRND